MIQLLGPMRTLAVGAALAIATTSLLAADRLAYSSFGKVRIGLSKGALERALHAPLVSDYSDPDSEAACHYVRSKSLPEGVSIMIRNGRVARVDVNAPGIATLSGAQIGMSERELKNRYRNRLAEAPHKYAWPEGRYLTLHSSDRTRAIRFETDGEVVTGFYAGTAESIQLAEGCQ